MVEYTKKEIELKKDIRIEIVGALSMAVFLFSALIVGAINGSLLEGELALILLYISSLSMKGSALVLMIFISYKTLFKN